MDPSKRMQAQEALQHTYLDGLREEYEQQIQATLPPGRPLRAPLPLQLPSARRPSGRAASPRVPTAPHARAAPAG